MKLRRGDIQGLRALAVILVIANHVFEWPGGGFVGVDVFFVISGFLITGLLLREHERTGRINFVDFYKRRIKRILPAAMAVLAVTVAAGYAILPKPRFDALVGDAVWAALFSSNWRSIALGTDYMHIDDALSPLQHFWSLSIEEQFYFVWPVILVVALTVGAARPRKTAGAVIATIAVFSFVFAVWETTTHPTSAYFSTFSRVWELAAGAILALSASKFTLMSDRVRPFIAWGGLATILASAFVLTDTTPFPGPWAIVPVVGTLAVLAAGIGGDLRALWPLTNSWSNYVGNLSYSLYLWHFPVLVFATMFLSETPRRLAAVAIVVTALLSILSYHFIENPVRFSSGSARLLRPAAAVLAIAVAATTVVSVAPTQRSSQAVAATADSPSVERTHGGPALMDRWAAIDEALDVNEWPRDLVPAYDNVVSADRVSEWVADDCLGSERGAQIDFIEQASDCSYGNPEAERVAVVFGDSTAIGWVPGVRAALEPQGFRVDVLTFEQCPAADIETKYLDGSAMPNCQLFRERAMERIAEIHPELVIATSTSVTLGRLQSGASGEGALREWQAASEASMSELSGIADDVFVLQAPPTRNTLDECMLKGSLPSDCYLGRTPVYSLILRADRALADGADVHFIETGSWFCSPDGRCPAFVGDSPVAVDGAHLTDNQSRSLAPVLAEVLTPTKN